MSNLQTANEHIQALTELFQVENADIKSGTFKNLPESAKRKAAHIKALEAMLADPKIGGARSALVPILQRLQRYASMNAVLLSSAANGVRAANQRLKDLNDREAQTGTYDRHGKTVRLSDSTYKKIKIV